MHSFSKLALGSSFFLSSFFLGLGLLLPSSSIYSNKINKFILPISASSFSAAKVVSTSSLSKFPNSKILASSLASEEVLKLL